MTLIGLFSGAKIVATPIGSATATEGGADFAALLGAVATPSLFTATRGSAAPAAAAPLPSPLSEIQENGTPAGAPTPVIPGIPAAAVDQTPEFSKGEQGAVIAGVVAAGSEAQGSAAPGAPRTRKTADAVADVAGTVAPVALTAPVVTGPAGAVASSPTPATSSASTGAAPTASGDAAPVIAAGAVASAATAATPSSTAPSAPAAPAASATPVTTLAVSGVEVELVVASVADKPAAVKQTTPDASGSAIAGVVAPGATGGVASAAPTAAARTNASVPANAPTFSAQVAKPLFTLAAGPAGEHVVTVNVTPDNLGPVTVRAHVGTEGMRVELFAPNDAGREAIRSILPDLRRDLAGQGVAANLDLSSQSQPFDRGGDTAARDRAAGQNLQARQDSAPRDGEQPSRRPHTSTSLLDVLA